MTWPFRKRRGIEAYIITGRGIDRSKAKSHEAISYEGAMILGALAHDGKLAIGDLVDLCAGSTSSIKNEVGKLQSSGFIERDDKWI